MLSPHLCADVECRLSSPADSDSPLVRDLIAEVRAGASLVKIESAKAYSSAMRAASRCEWPKRKTTITPYCLWHTRASDMKATSMDSCDISAALGHVSDITRQDYGSFSQGGGAKSVAPANVEAAREVEIGPKSKYISTIDEKGHKLP